MMTRAGGTIRRMAGDELLTIPKAANELAVSHMTIRRWIKAGHLQAIKPGSDYLIYREHLEPFRRRENRPRPGRPRTTPAPREP